MKKVIIIAVLLPLFAFAQKNVSEKIFPEVNGEINYTEVVKVDSTIKKDELYVNAKAWFVGTYKSANDVLQMQDKEAGVLIGKGIFEIPYKLFVGSTRVSVNHTIKVYVKDGKYKYEITDLEGKQLTTYGWKSFDINKAKNDINKKILSIISSLKTAMQKPITSKDF